MFNVVTALMYSSIYCNSFNICSIDEFIKQMSSVISWSCYWLLCISNVLVSTGSTGCSTGVVVSIKCKSQVSSGDMMEQGTSKKEEKKVVGC